MRDDIHSGEAQENIWSRVHHLFYAFSKNFMSRDTLESLEKIENSYRSMRVVGRGTVVVDPKEVLADASTEEMFVKARDIVSNYK